MLRSLLDELHALTDAGKGRAFERLCRWYLESAPEYRPLIRRVWLWNEWPGRWGADAGIDLIAETKSGEVWAVQAKAYSPSYTVKKADVDSFLSESNRPEIDYRLLIATTDGLGANAARTLHAQDKPVGVKLLSQLRAEEVAWPETLRHLRPRRPERKRPREHQREAIRDVVRGLRDRDRGQLLMACGTGKTLTSLWIDERLRSERTLVLVPSLSLLGQTLRSWAASAQTPFEYLAVCSDDTVTGTDDFTAHAADLGFPVTTNASDVARFLRRRSGRRVVFCTYQSSPVVARSQTTSGVPRFDVVFADEAHRCAGPATGDFATVLDDRKIKARKRVFMTATPRYLSGRVQRAGTERDYEVISMDDEAAFGPVLHQLTFGKAIKRDLLADYRVVVVGVDEPTYARYAQRGELVTRDGATVTDARTLARQIGLARAMRKFDLHRVISFHSRVAAARRFANDLPDVIAWMPRQAGPKGALWTHHVSGEMNAGQREALLDRFRQLDGDERGVLSNARCLAEGVDVPAIDGVAFIDPRRSTVDILQAVGRAIRQAPDKTLGTIVIPVFIEPGLADQDVLNTSDFRPVWDIVRALRAHDEVIGEQLDHARRELGRARAGLEAPDKVVLDLPSTVGVDFARAFDARLVEQTSAPWEFWFGLLESFAGRTGGANVPTDHQESGYPLGKWVSHQRWFQSRGILDQTRADRLEAVEGWTWHSTASAWESMFTLLETFIELNGDSRVPQGYVTDGGVRLGGWVARQRAARDSLTADRVRRLSALPGWAWSGEVHQEVWERKFAALQRFALREGHARVPANHTAEDGIRLGYWVAGQRSSYQRGRLPAERRERLQRLPGWVWAARDAAWEDAFVALEAYAKRTGNARPHRDQREAGIRIAEWVVGQRFARSRGTLSTDRAARLERLPGWTWSAREASWNEHFAALSEFCDREGHSSPTAKYREGSLELGTWVANQRTRFRAGTLSADQKERLEGLPGWEWDPRSAQWDDAFEALRRFAAREGHARVPAAHVEAGVNLGAWVNSQRQGYRRSTLGSDRTRRLEALPGWTWVPHQQHWDEGMDALQEFVRRNGHARVPSGHVEGGFRLGNWVANLRRRRPRLQPDRISALEATPGWAWGRRDGARSRQ